MGESFFFPFIVTALLHHETCGDLGPCAVVDLALVAFLCSSWTACLVAGVVLRL